jgi:hypothetical protein
MNFINKSKGVQRFPNNCGCGMAGSVRCRSCVKLSEISLLNLSDM